MKRNETHTADSAMPLIFVVEDDRDISSLIVHTLKGSGFAARPFLDGESVVEAAREQTPALILLDLMLPGWDGMEILRSLGLQQRTREIRKIILSARGSEAEKVRGLELGADDFITKPFSPRELILRIKAVLRSLPGDSEHNRVLQVGDLFADLDARTLTAENGEVQLTATEFDILVQLMLHTGYTLSRDKLLASIRPVPVFAGDGRMIDVYIRRLREKLEADPSNPRRLVTRRRGGYALLNPTGPV